MSDYDKYSTPLSSRYASEEMSKIYFLKKRFWTFLQMHILKIMELSIYRNLTLLKLVIVWVEN